MFVLVTPAYPRNCSPKALYGIPEPTTGETKAYFSKPYL